MLPRCVLVERPTEYADLLARHGTRQAVGFFLEQRGLTLDEVERRHLAYAETRAGVLAAVPVEWRTSAITRAELDRFLFARTTWWSCSGRTAWSPTRRSTCAASR